MFCKCWIQITRSKAQTYINNPNMTKPLGAALSLLFHTRKDKKTWERQACSYDKAHQKMSTESDQNFTTKQIAIQNRRRATLIFNPYADSWVLVDVIIERHHLNTFNQVKEELESCQQ